MRRVLILSVLLAAILLAIVSPRAAGAQTNPRDEESFNYCGGVKLDSLDGGSEPWKGPWLAARPGRIVIGDATLHDAGGKLSSPGKSARTPSLTGAADFSEVRRKGGNSSLGVNGRTVYFGFLLQPVDSVGSGGEKGSGGLVLGEPGQPRLFIGLPPNSATGKYALADSAGGGVQASAIVARKGETVLLVVRAEFKPGNDEFRLYVNPVPGDPEPGTPAAIRNDLDLGGFSTLAIRAGTGWLFDELRDGPSFEAATFASKETAVIPLMARVMNNVATTLDDVKAIVKIANTYLKQANARIEFDEKHFERNYLKGVLNPDDQIPDDKDKQSTFEDPLVKAMDKPVADGGFGEKGVAVIFTNLIRGKDGTLGSVKGANPYRPVISMKAGQGNSEMGQTLAHEIGHTFGLYVAALIDRTKKSDSHGHVIGDRCNLMFEKNSREAEYVTARQLKTLAYGAQRRARTKVKAPEGEAPKPDRQGALGDPAGDVAGVCVDLIGAGLFAPAPDDTLEAMIELSDVLSATEDIEASYQLFLDRDGQPGTGLTSGPFVGADHVLTIRLTGHAPFTPPAGLVETELLDVAANITVPLPPGEVLEVRSLEDPDSTDVFVAHPYGAAIRQRFSTAGPGSIAPVAPWGVLATRFEAGAPVEQDTTGAGLLRLRPLAGPGLSISPLYPQAGQSLFVSGSGFAPNVNLQILIDDDVLTTTVTDGAGDLGAFATVPDLPQGFYFITVPDTTDGDFDYAILDIARPDLPVPVETLESFVVMAGPGSLELRWSVRDPGRFQAFQIWRSEPGNPFHGLAGARVTTRTGTDDGPASPTLRWRDGAVEPGIEYAYRLEALRRDGTSELWAATVTGRLAPGPPPGLSLSIVSARPLRAGRDLELVVVLPGATQNPSLDLLGIDGRRVMHLYEGSLEAGPRTLRLPAARLARVAGGIYWLRLTAGPNVASERLTILP